MKYEFEQSTGSSAIPESWIRHYNYAKETFSDDEVLIYLQDDYIEELRLRIRLTEPNAAYLKETMQFIRNDAHVRFLFWLWHCILFRKEDEQGNEILSWPVPQQPVGMKGQMAGLFPAVVLLSGYPSSLSAYKKLGNVPDSILNDTLTSVEECMNIYYVEKGQHGLSLLHMNRLLNHFRANLFRIGRLEYHLNLFRNQITLYRNSTNGLEIILSQPGVCYRKDGRVDGTNHIFGKKEEVWTSSFKETSEYVEGHLISSDGYAKNELVVLPKKDWTCILQEADPVLNMHIPREGALNEAVLQDSFREAVIFFRMFFPETTIRALVCNSWMLDPQLQLFLDNTSNLVMFQKLFHLYPVLSMDHSIFKFVFRCEPCPVEELTATTSLQQKIKDYMLAGGHMNSGGGIITVN